MATEAEYDDGTPRGMRRWLPLAIAAVLLAVAGWWLYSQVTGVRGVKVDAPPPTVVDMLPPPPPPPPPPPEPQEKPPEPTEAPDPVPNPEPAPQKPDAPAPMTIAGEAQAGADSFGLSAGSGGGMGAPSAQGTCIGPNCGGGGGGGGGLSDGFYRRYLSGVLQQRVQGNDRINRLVFSADFAITIAAGRVTQAQLLRSTGDKERDRLLEQILEGVSGLDAPPASVRFPQRVTVRGRRAI